MSNDAVIECSALTKTYKTFWGRPSTSLDGLDLVVRAGETFGLLGPNGAGKTTSQKLFLGLLRPSAGSVRVLGQSPDEPAVRSRVGFLPENPYFYTYLTGREFLEFCADLFSMSARVKQERVTSLLRLVRMEESANLQMRRYSKGMLQRIGIAQALINDPELVFLDEPTSGLDPLGHKQITDIILELKAQGKTLFFNSHVMNDVQALCDRIGILHRGRLLVCGSLSELLMPGESLEAFFVRTIERAELSRNPG
ncbi:MAG: ABC transporter ATP-binding protein [Candidatus Sericytochromatia bacterium]|nr:ABC transporter ATP-binding protein [Candidatus Sericytochromatia bacterium]